MGDFMDLTRNQPDQSDLFGIKDEGWGCMVCGDRRFFDEISVAHRDSSIGGLGTWNVSYCNDRLTCTLMAHAAGPWPAPPPVLQDDTVLTLTRAAVDEGVWATRRDLPELVIEVINLIRAQPSTPKTLLGTYPHPPHMIFDVCRQLVQFGVLTATRPS